MAKLHCVVILGVVAAVVSTVSAISDEDKAAIKAELIPLLVECGKEFETSKEDVLAAKDAKDVDALKPCFYGCILKKRGIINEEGNFDADVAKAEHAKYVHDAEMVPKLDSIADTCKSVNAETVTDGDKGCERAVLAIKCMFKHKDVAASIF